MSPYWARYVLGLKNTTVTIKSLYEKPALGLDSNPNYCRTPGLSHFFFYSFFDFVNFQHSFPQMLHHGSLINQLLPIVEQGFKNQSPEIKRRAYRTWETLIDNFALTPGKDSPYTVYSNDLTVCCVSHTS